MTKRVVKRRKRKPPSRRWMLGAGMAVVSIALSLLSITGATLWTVYSNGVAERERMANIEARVTNLEKGVDRLTDRLIPPVFSLND